MAPALRISASSSSSNSIMSKACRPSAAAFTRPIKIRSLPTTASVVEGALEQSNVSAVTEITQMIEIMRSYEQTVNLIGQENQRHR